MRCQNYFSKLKIKKMFFLIKSDPLSGENDYFVSVLGGFVVCVMRVFCSVSRSVECDARFSGQ